MSGHTLAMRRTVFSSASTKERSTGGLFIFVVYGLNGKLKFACLCRDTVNLAVGLEHQTSAMLKAMPPCRLFVWILTLILWILLAGLFTI